MEEQLSKFYTIAILKKFQDKIKALVNCSPSLIQVEGLNSTYEVNERIKRKGGKNEVKSFEVMCQSKEQEANCISCSLRFRGIVCRRAVCVRTY